MGVEFVLRWTEPKHPNCDISHYRIYISGGIKGKATLPPEKREYIFKTNVKLTDESIYGDKAVIDKNNLSIRIFQFQISADSSKENLTGEPSFITSDLSNFKKESSLIENDPIFINNIFFRPVPNVLIYDNIDESIKLLDLDAKQTIQTHKILKSTNSLDPDVQQINIK